MFGRRTYNDGFIDGVEETIAVIENRADRAGNAVNVRNAVLEIRALLLNQHPLPQHDEPRS